MLRRKRKCIQIFAACVKRLAATPSLRRIKLAIVWALPQKSQEFFTCTYEITETDNYFVILGHQESSKSWTVKIICLKTAVKRKLFCFDLK